MTDDSQSGGHDGSGVPNDGEHHSADSGSRGDGKGARPRSGFGRGGSGRDDRSGRDRSGSGKSGSRDGDQRRDGSGRRSEPRNQGGRGDRDRGRTGHGRGNRDFRPGGQRSDRDRSPERGDRDHRDRSTEQRDPGDTAPKLREDVSHEQLDREIWSELGTLPRSLAETVARHLVAAGELLDDEPGQAYEHATYARRKASRVGAVREAAGLAAYRMGKWQEALSDLRAARRMTGRSSFLPVMADCERGLGRPERALEITRERDVEQLEVAERIELRIVASGARRDLGQLEAARVELQVPELKERRARPWVARLFYAYADVLLELGRNEEAREYFARASAVDREGHTDADERLAELEGVDIVDADDDIVWIDAEDSGKPEEPGGPEKVPGEGPQAGKPHDGGKIA